jgi:hypothetical protein
VAEVEFKQKLQLASRTSRYKNQLAPPRYSTSPTIMGTITKNYIIIVLFEKSNSKPTSLCLFSLMLRAYWRSNKYQFYSVWFDPTGA